MSQPELAMIITMVGFFDTSIDVLLGYEMKDNRLQASVDRLKQYRHEKNPEGLTEAEKALKKYPLHLWFSRPSWLGFGTLYHAVSEMRILEFLKENK